MIRLPGSCNVFACINEDGSMFILFPNDAMRKVQSTCQNIA